MIKKIYLKYNQLLWEIFRYLLVGGLAFLVDYFILIIFREFVFPKGQYIYNVDWGLFSATTLGFIAGLTFNYILSIIFVFKNTKNKDSGKSVKDFIIFSVIGVIGLILTLGGMQLLVEGLNIHYAISKIIMTIIVLAWNYIARKILIFK